MPAACHLWKKEADRGRKDGHKRGRRESWAQEKKRRGGGVGESSKRRNQYEAN